MQALKTKSNIGEMFNIQEKRKWRNRNKCKRVI